MIHVDPSRSKRSVPHKTGCAVESALALIGGRWKGVVIYRLLQGTQRFSSLRKFLPSCSPRMLTLQLRELEEDGLVRRTVYAEVPPRVEYDLTAFGRTLEPVILGLCEWGQLYKRKIERALKD
jgi:DNA-binding HxlR family transcriptional regulator